MPAAIDDLKALLREALAIHRAGGWPQAESLYRQSLELEPENPHLLHLLGLLLHQMERSGEGAGLIRQAIALAPNCAEFHNSLGNALRTQGDLAGAARSFETALALHPRSAEVFTNLGALLEQAGNLDDATLCYLRALELDPAYGDAHYTLANLLKRVGNFTGAVKHYELAVDPGYEYAPEALNNLGTALRLLGRPAEAVERFRQAIVLRAPYLEAHVNLAGALEDAGRLEEAARMYQAILMFRPDSAIAYSGTAGILQDQGRPERATAAYRKAVDLAPDNPVLASNLLLQLHYDPSPDCAELLAAHRQWDERHARSMAREVPRRETSRDAGRPLRVGFVSADFRRHPVGSFLAPVLASRLRDGFEYVCYSDVAAPDAVTERLRWSADLWRPTWSLDDGALADLIRQDRIDILVDLAGHTRGNRLLVFARKPAPVQVTWLGYPDTTGMAQMDYLVSDRWLTVPASERWLVEKVARMPDGSVCYMPPEDAPPVSPLPAAAAGYITFGCSARLSQINADVVRAWSQLLREVPGSRLLLRARELADEAAARRSRKMFRGEGVEEARLDFAAPTSEPLAVYSRIDIALDPFPYSGSLATCEALWMGVPVVTLAGERIASRQSASHLYNIGLDEMVTDSPESYLAQAQRLARNPDRLAGLRSGLRDRIASSPLADSERFAANFKALLGDLWLASCPS